MRKTARPVVWEGDGAQSPSLDPINLCTVHWPKTANCTRFSKRFMNLHASFFVVTDSNYTILNCAVSHVRLKMRKGFIPKREMSENVSIRAGRRVVTASDDKTARVWDAETGKPVGAPLQHQQTVNIAAFSPDGRRVVTASVDNTPGVWGADTG